MSDPNDFIIPGQEPLIAPGVRGYTFEDEKEVWIPLIFAVRKGNGDVGRYLDGLPRSKRIIVPTVTSSRLAGMLARRGFTEKGVTKDGDYCHAYVRESMEP